MHEHIGDCLIADKWLSVILERYSIADEIHKAAQIYFLLRNEKIIFILRLSDFLKNLFQYNHFYHFRMKTLIADLIKISAV